MGLISRYIQQTSIIEYKLHLFGGRFRLYPITDDRDGSDQSYNDNKPQPLPGSGIPIKPFLTHYMYLLKCWNQIHVQLK
jgi:hypothetical protein